MFSRFPGLPPSGRRFYAGQTLSAIGEEYGARWLCAGAISKKGHPHHPLYLRKDEPLRPFDAKTYLDSLA